MSDERLQIRSTARWLVVVMWVIAIAAMGLFFLTGSRIFGLPIEFAAAMLGTTFADGVKEFAASPTPSGVARARKFMYIVAALWAAGVLISFAFGFNPLNLIDAAVWLFLLFVMRNTVTSMARVAATLA